MRELDLYLLLDEHVNLEPIHALLKRYKEKYPAEITLGGTKQELIDNLKSNVLSKRIPESDVFALLQEGEENGDQHIFYYCPRESFILDQCRNGAAVAATLFGADWKTAAGFPKIVGIPNSYEVADFRININGKPRDWLLKIYGLKLAHRRIGKQQLGLNQYSIIYREDLERSVCIARWNDNPGRGLLEIRVTRSGRKKRVDVDVNAVWDRLRQAFAREDFTPWDLSVPLGWMIDHEREERNVYSIGSARVTHSAEGVVAFHPHDEHERLGDRHIRQQTLQTLLREGGRCVSLVVTWLANGSGGRLSDDLRTYLGARAISELVVGAKTSSATLLYVTDLLRHYAAKAPAREQQTEPPAKKAKQESPLTKSALIDLTTEHPQLAEAMRAIGGWLQKNGERKFVSEAELAADLPSIDALALAGALQVLVREKYLTRIYRLRVPNGEYIAGEYASWKEIPKKVVDRFHAVEHKTKNLELVTIYRWGEGNAPA